MEWLRQPDNYMEHTALFLTVSCFLLFGLSILGVKSLLNNSREKEPPWVPNGLPLLGHFYAYVFHNVTFMRTVLPMIQKNRIMRFKIGPQGFYLVTGPKNTQAVLRNTAPIRYLSSNDMVQRNLKQLLALTKPDLIKFRIDNSGRGHRPLPGTNVAESDRIWSAQHRIFVDNLSTQNAVEVMTAKFIEVFTDFALQTRPVGHVETTNLYAFVKEAMVRSATTALCGSELLRFNPDFVKAYFDYDSSVFGLIFGIPRFIYSRSYNNRDRWHRMGEKWLRAALETENWEAKDQDKDWDDMFGLRFVRERLKYLKQKDFDIRSQAGMHLGTIWALNTNTIPIVGWGLIEIIRDKELFQEVRAEVSSAFDVTEDGTRKINMDQIITAPLLQSIYVEILRLHDSINITREVTQDMVLDGYKIKKGYLIQAPSYLAHHDDTIWDDTGHPTDQFWAKRHITYVTKRNETGEEVTVPEFSLESRGKNFFPYGGGMTICPGRHMAKREIMSAIATIVVNFDIELLDYIMADGSDEKSDRLPLDDTWYGGFGSMEPDREVKIRWTRI